MNSKLPLVAALLAISSSSLLMSQQRSVSGVNGVVVSVEENASRTGVAILKKGGNAIDAAVATAFVLAVTYPQAGNIGGGGFMLIRMANGESAAIDYREKAPARASAGMFYNASGQVDTIKSEYGYLVAGVPGTVRGLETAWMKYGKLPWRELVQPAIELAEKGFALAGHHAKEVESYRNDLSVFPETRKIFFKNDGSAYKAGENWQQPDLANTLKAIAEKGSAGFYEGETAKRIEKDFAEHGGLIDQNDLKEYQAVVRKPVTGTYRGFTVIGLPPPSSGGIGLIEMLNILEPFSIKDDLRSRHIIAEAMRKAFYDRARFLGDPDFVKVPADSLLSKSHARIYASQIDTAKAAPSNSLSGDLTFFEESMETTHFSVIDKEGNAVSNTYTLEDNFGSKAVVTGCGFLLNNEMHDFNVDPDHPNYRGFGANPNVIRPGKRMLSSMTPTIIVKDGKPWLLTGSPGGRTIINTVLQMTVGMIDYHLTLRGATDMLRINHNWMPDVLTYERSWSSDALNYFRMKGHDLSVRSFIGDAHSIWIDPKSGRYYGEADARIMGSAQGY